ncbi:unnamed protein product [Protopolystoma xenopodis]|uniref:Uncharacterized protein n=1 Tax=Protopolystoma xenopodis TaxID=117903 RepID=A0A3S5AJE5_9PLAT|nr:unnamed protein product [Protopolystoma xenopodis]
MSLFSSSGLHETASCLEREAKLKLQQPAPLPLPIYDESHRVLEETPPHLHSCCTPSASSVSSASTIAATVLSSGNSNDNVYVNNSLCNASENVSTVSGPLSEIAIVNLATPNLRFTKSRATHHSAVIQTPKVYHSPHTPTSI